jgi:hypothetical protein
MKVYTPNHCNRRLLSSLASLDVKHNKPSKAASISRPKECPALSIRVNRKAPEVSQSIGISLFKAFQAINEGKERRPKIEVAEKSCLVLTPHKLN